MRVNYGLLHTSFSSIPKSLMFFTLLKTHSCFTLSSTMLPLLAPFTLFKLAILTLQLQAIPITLTLSPCKNSCGNIPIKYPFGIEDGCGAPQFRHMLNCTNDLFFQTPSGAYKVQSIDYDKNSMVIYDPAMSTCSILQPHHDFVMTDVQSAIIPPSQDTVFVLLNCSIDSPVLNHYKYLCFNFEGHTCDELYSSCNAFRVFHLLTNSSPPCCFTSYSTVKFMSMNILDCTHYTSVFNTNNLKGVGPLDWVYGIKMSFSVPETGCESCKQSGGTCGFDTDTEGLLCLCSASNNSTRQCGAGSVISKGESNSPWKLYQLVLFVVTFLHTLDAMFFVTLMIQS